MKMNLPIKVSSFLSFPTPSAALQTTWKLSRADFERFGKATAGGRRWGSHIPQPTEITIPLSNEQ